ncbi:hypothetical protein HN682_09690 [Candidatus Peregrinibacteria bacterium]|jgi:hypothetical protein|nr:hypothetical protein [Candidatus Peregrinibacteria bacterium]
MIILIGTILAVVLGVILIVACWDDCNYGMGVGLGITIVSGFVLVILVIAFPMERMEAKRLMRNVATTQETIDEARKDSFGNVERMALTRDMISLNKEIVNAKYWNTTVWDIWIPDYVEQIEMLK